MKQWVEMKPVFGFLLNVTECCRHRRLPFGIYGYGGKDGKNKDDKFVDFDFSQIEQERDLGKLVDRHEK